LRFLLRPSVLTNHRAWLGLFIAGTFLIAPAVAVLVSIHDPDRIMARLFLAATWPQLLWIITVSIEAQRWQNKWTPGLIWVGVWLTVALSIILTPDGSAYSLSAVLMTWVSISGFCLSLQIACLLETGWGARVLYMFLVAGWPFFMSLFTQRLRSRLEAAHSSALSN